MGFSVKRLNKRETQHAKHFLYSVYAGQLNWLPQPDNPSGWAVERDEDGEYFDDIYNDTARWFGVYDGGPLAASGRLLYPVGSKLEIELYDSIPDEFRGNGLSRVEMNRIAVDESYNGTEALSLLFREMLLFVREHQIDCIFTAAPESTLPIIEDMNFRILRSFKYAPEDTSPAYCAVFEAEDPDRITETLVKIDGKAYYLDFG